MKSGCRRYEVLLAGRARKSTSNTSPTLTNALTLQPFQHRRNAGTDGAERAEVKHQATTPPQSTLFNPTVLTNLPLSTTKGTTDQLPPI